MWVDFGINSWNDLLFKTFGEIYFEINKFQGKNGLEMFIKELRRINEKIGKIPPSNMNGVNSIYRIANKCEWKEIGVFSWNDLLMRTFGKINIYTVFKVINDPN